MFKAIAKYALERAGYEVQRKLERIEPDARWGFNVFELVVDRLAASNPGLTLLQVGANDGVEEDPVRELLQRHQFRAFLCEPLPDAFEKLKANYRGFPSVTLLQLAVGEAAGTIPIFRVTRGATNENDTLIASFNRAHVEHFARLWRVKEVISEDVRCVTVANLMLQNNIEHIDVAAVDTEGYDHVICNQLLDLPRPPQIIHFEFAVSPRDAVRALMERLTACGYKFTRSGLDVTAVHNSASIRLGQG